MEGGGRTSGARPFPPIRIDSGVGEAEIQRSMRETGAFPVYGGTDFSHTSERGELRMWLAAPTVLVMAYRGYSDAAFIEFIEDVWNQTLETTPGRVQIFADTERQTGFAHGFRTGMARWNRRIVARTDTYCVLVKSRWIAMGIALVRATIGGPARHAEVTTRRDVFHARLDSAVRRSRPRYEVIMGAGGAAETAAFSEASGRSLASSDDGSDGR
jgi:hypothetical protein